MRPFRPGVRILNSIRKYRLEPDQTLLQALATAPDIADRPHDISDAGIFTALYRLNSILTRYLDIDFDAHRRNASVVRSDVIRDPEEARIITGRGRDSRDLAGPPLARIFEIAAERAVSRGDQTLSSGDFITAAMRVALETGNSYEHRPVFVDYLARARSGSEFTPISELSGVVSLLEVIEHADGTEDFQYVLTVENDRVVFRVASTLGDYVTSEAGVLIPRRAILALGERFGCFSDSEILELDDLLNSPVAREADYQAFLSAIHTFCVFGITARCSRTLRLPATQVILFPTFCFSTASCSELRS